ncbi:hypothetical protein [Streptomyces brevispora]|uniref:Uncharacterized protein n=1 Tax=Streptomyces brevispora TaxID=887462 RepID=A0A561UYV5_9ACTN|nr:hypothetical protein [Streptomyces brevispora]TWG04519.1 hypothetical protein FHX80_112972 [Streptomyces brevispora]WSC14423.1 hypothetical protein OIE64_17320 [Streptomyces brevispora]
MNALAAVLRETTQPDDGVVYLSVKRRAWELADTAPIAGWDLARAHNPLASHSLYGTEVGPASSALECSRATGSAPSPHHPASLWRTTPCPV